MTAAAKRSSGNGSVPPQATKAQRVLGLAMLILQTVAVSALGASGIKASDAVVLVSSRGFDRMGLGNGFAVGDGSLIVTACHVAFDHFKEGRHLMPGRITVFSPYLGDACHGVILAYDEALDLAVIQVPWKGHPSLALASDNEIILADRLQTLRLTHVSQALLEDPSRRPTAEDLLQGDTLDVDTVAVRGRIPRFVQLAHTGRLGQGWSGSPMILPDSGKAVACFTTLSGTTVYPSGIALPQRPHGPAVSQLRRLLGPDRYRTHIAEARSGPPMAAGLDALEAFTVSLLANLQNRPGTYEQALLPAKRFAEMRPDNPIGYEFVAFALDRLNRKDEARTFYEKALTYEPMSAETQLYYSQLLSDIGEPNQAMEILERLKDQGTSKELACIAMVNVLGAEGRYERCIQLLDEALQANPRNAYLWQQKAGCLAYRLGMKPNLEVAECMEKAVTLRPEIGPWRGSLAHLLRQLGELDRAESHFRKLLEIEPNNPVVYVWLAEFLEQQRPAARQQAIEIAERALRLPPAPKGPPKDEIEQLITRLKSEPPAADKTTPESVAEP